MTLRQDIATILTSRECQHINFELRGVLVTGALFRRVANTILNTQPPVPIRIATNPAMVSRTSIAEYSSYDDTLYLRGANIFTGVADIATVVHECVHIIGDIRRAIVVGMDDEAAAFIAQTWYMINCGASSQADPNMLPIVTNILSRSGGAGSPASVTQAERHDMHRILLGYSYTWQNTRYGRFDGVPGASR